MEHTQSMSKKLVKEVIDAMEAAMADPCVKFDMTTWFNYVPETKTCTVCSAGAWIYAKLKQKNDFPTKKEYHHFGTVLSTLAENDFIVEHCYDIDTLSLGLWPSSFGPMFRDFPEIANAQAKQERGFSDPVKVLEFFKIIYNKMP